MNKKEIKARAEKCIDETLATFRQIDDHLWTLEYKCDYGLDELLEKGCSNIMDAVI